MFNFKTTTFLKSMIFISFFALSSAYFVEFILDHKPCSLCKLQRIPYIASLILISSFFIFKFKYKVILVILTLFFIFGTVISFYHYGIEEGFFNESFLCKLQGNFQVDSASELLSQLKTSNISCKEVPLSLFGFSLATINAIFSLAISVILVGILINYEKNK